jgi:hypothetical protein
VTELAESYAGLDLATKDLNRDWPKAAVPLPPYWSGAFSLLDIQRQAHSRYGMPAAAETLAGLLNSLRFTAR